MNITLPVEIDAPVARVWALIDDPENIKLWMPEVVETIHPDGIDRANPVGTRFIQRIKEGGRVKEYEGVVRAYEPGRHLGIRLVDKHFHVDVDYHLSEDRGGTRLDYSCRGEMKSWIARIMGFLARPMAMRQLTRYMANLKRVAEQGERKRVGEEKA